MALSKETPKLGLTNILSCLKYEGDDDNMTNNNSNNMTVHVRHQAPQRLCYVHIQLLFTHTVAASPPSIRLARCQSTIDSDVRRQVKTRDSYRHTSAKQEPFLDQSAGEPNKQTV